MMPTGVRDIQAKVRVHRLDTELVPTERFDLPSLVRAFAAVRLDHMRPMVGGPVCDVQAFVGMLNTEFVVDVTCGLSRSRSC
ncbi:hypothetical protein RKD18_001314 [Streptomyces phaeoluteigriseus]